MGTIYLYSPIRPVKSGTAHYFELLMRQIVSAGIGIHDVTVVVDERFYEHGVLGESPYRVVDYRNIERGPDDLNLYFLANNEYHRYIHRLLYSHKREYGKAISIVHEPCMWMNVAAMCNLHEYGFSEEDIPYFASYEFGDETALITELAARSGVDKNFEYTSIAGTHLFENSNAIVFHSNYAREKFITERSASYEPRRSDRPQYYLMSHPPEASLQTMDRVVCKDKFIVGIYGWAKSVKQVEEVIRGFTEFYESLTAADRSNVSLQIVGKVDDEHGFDPVGLANRLAARDAISFFGYVGDQEMDDMLAQSSLLFSLRFPSCGETSGPLYKAKALGVPVVLSDYAAFAEEPAEYHIPVEKHLQHYAIVKVLSEEFSAFKRGNSRPIDYSEKLGQVPTASILDILDEARTL